VRKNRRRRYKRTDSIGLKLNNTTSSILPKGGCSNLNLPLALKSQKEEKANLDLDRKDGDGGDALILFVHQEKSNITPTSI